MLTAIQSQDISSMAALNWQNYGVFQTQSVSSLMSYRTRKNIVRIKMRCGHAG